MSAFTEALFELPTERLRQMATRREIDPRRLLAARNKLDFVTLFAQELARPQSINEALRHCTARELRLLQHLVSSENALVPWAKLAEMTGLEAPQSALSEVIEGLTERGLAFRRDKGVLLGAGVQQCVPVSPSDRYRLSQLLNNYDALAVKTIRETLGIAPAKDTKADNIERISEHLLSPNGVRLARPLDEQEQEVLDFIVAAGGSAMAGEIATTVLHSRLQDFYGYDWQNRWKQGRGRNAVDRLLARGLVYVVSWSYGFNLMLVIPGDLLRAMSGGDETGFWTGALPALEPMQEPIEQTKKQTALVKDVVQFLGLLATLDATRTNTGQIHRTALKNAARLMSLTEDKYALFVYSLCRSANLIAPVGEKQIYTLTKTGDQFLHKDAAEQWRTLYDAWHGSALWAEMDTEPLAKEVHYRDTAMVVSIRDAALDVIRQSEGEAFYTVDSVTDVMVSCSPLILAHNAFGINVVPTPAAFVRYLVAEPLYWMGVLEIGEPKGWTEPQPQVSMRINRAFRTEEVTKPALPDPPAFRLTPAGRWLLEKNDADPPAVEPREEQFILQPNAEVFVSPYLAPAVLYRLLTITEVPKNSTGSMVNLTKESIRKALDHGETIQEIVAFFQSHSRTGIPQNVEYLVNEVGGKHGHIHIGKANLYLQTDTPFLMQEILARKELKPYTARALSDTIVLLQGDNYDKLLKDLRKAGYLPVSDEDAPVAQVASRSAKSAAPRYVDVPTEKPAKKSSGKTLDDINWGKLAEDDDKIIAPMQESARVNASMAKHPELIRFILNQGIRNNLRVEISYLEGEAGQANIYLLEPVKMTPQGVRAFDREDEEATFGLSRIEWARLTDEKFVPR